MSKPNRKQRLQQRARRNTPSKNTNGQTPVNEQPVATMVEEAPVDIHQEPHKEEATQEEYLATLLINARKAATALRVAVVQAEEREIGLKQTVYQLRARIVFLENQADAAANERLWEEYGLTEDRLINKDDKTGEVWWTDAPQPQEQGPPSA